MAALKANLGECLRERDVLRRIEKECNGRDNVDGDSVQWMDKIVSGMKEQITEDVCAVREEGEEEEEK